MDPKLLLESSKRRIHHIVSVLEPNKREQDRRIVYFRATSSNEENKLEIDYFDESTLPKRIIIGDVAVDIVRPSNPELIPFDLNDMRLFVSENTQEMFLHLKWMLQKDVLNQDMFLIGPAGLKISYFLRKKSFWE